VVVISEAERDNTTGIVELIVTVDPVPGTDWHTEADALLWTAGVVVVSWTEDSYDWPLGRDIVFDVIASSDDPAYDMEVIPPIPMESDSSMPSQLLHPTGATVCSALANSYILELPPQATAEGVQELSGAAILDLSVVLSTEPRERVVVEYVVDVTFDPDVEALMDDPELLRQKLIDEALRTWAQPMTFTPEAWAVPSPVPLAIHYDGMPIEGATFDFLIHVNTTDATYSLIPDEPCSLRIVDFRPGVLFEKEPWGDSTYIVIAAGAALLLAAVIGVPLLVWARRKQQASMKRAAAYRKSSNHDAVTTDDSGAVDPMSPAPQHPLPESSDSETDWAGPRQAESRPTDPLRDSVMSLEDVKAALDEQPTLEDMDDEAGVEHLTQEEIAMRAEWGMTNSTAARALPGAASTNSNFNEVTQAHEIATRLLRGMPLSVASVERTRAAVESAANAMLEQALAEAAGEPQADVATDEDMEEEAAAPVDTAEANAIIAGMLSQGAEDLDTATDSDGGAHADVATDSDAASQASSGGSSSEGGDWSNVVV
jgi:hypothetical protein